MSQENVAIVRQLYNPDVELRQTTSLVGTTGTFHGYEGLKRGARDAGTYRGYEELQRWMEAGSRPSTSSP